MKNYTYDFNGKLIPLDSMNQTSFHVNNVHSEYSGQYKKRSLSPSRKSSNKQVNQILDKKLVQIGKTPLLDPIAEQIKKKRQKEIEEETQKKRSIFNKHQANNKFTNLFNKNTRVAMGITITNMEDNEYIGSKEKKVANDIKRLTLSQFKNSTKGEEFFPSKRNLKLKRNNKTTYFKTEGN